MRVARFLAILVLLVAIIAAALYLLRLPLAGWAVRSAMAGAGLERPQAQVTALTLNGIVLKEVSAGPAGREAFRIESAEADYDWRELLATRSVDAVRAGPGFVRASVSATGEISVAGLNSGDGGGGGGGALPFSTLRISDIALYLDTPDGSAEGLVTADYDVREGGSAMAALTTGGVSLGGVDVFSGNAQAELTLSADGQMAFLATFDGDAGAHGVNARRVDFSIDGEGRSWRDMVSGDATDATGTARIAFDAPEILFSTPSAQDTVAGVMTITQVEALFGEPVNQAALTGAFNATLFADGFEIRLAPDAPLALTTPDGAGLTLASAGGAPIYARKGARETASFQFALKSDGVNASGSADAEREGDFLRVAAPVRIEEYASPDLSLDGSKIDFSATVEGDALTADVALESGLKRAQIGRLTLSDAPFSSAFNVQANLSAKTASIFNKEKCITLERGRARIAEQNAEAVLGRTQLCNADGPLAVFTWAGDMVCTLNGEISATSGRFRLGETTAAGKPPVIRFNAVYNPLENRTSVDGAISNGAMTLNEILDLSAALGRFDFSLDPEMMRASGAISRVRVAQSGESPLFTPLIATGNVTLEGDKTLFDYALKTPGGKALGTGSGAHDMATATGETVFSLDGLEFQPDGLQPNELVPSLKGIVSAAEGGADGSVRFGWAPDGVTSGANIGLRDISFAGPTLAVTGTLGVNGDVALTNLLPVTTDGLQRITVDAVDLDALQLNDGEISFELPGDDTFYLERGEFPWFGGSLGVYEATASLSGEAKIPLRADNIDLKQIFDYVKVNGLSGEGMLTGSLPLVFEQGKARIENGVLRSVGPGVVRYSGAASEQAAAADDQAEIAFDILRELQYTDLQVTVNGALDGRLEFQMLFEGSGEVSLENAKGRVPVKYRINLDAALLELLRQANLTTDIKLQLERGRVIAE